MLINWGFHTRNNLSANIPQFVHPPSTVRQPYPRPKKSLKNIDLKGRRIIHLPRVCVGGGGTCLGPFLVVRRRLVFVYRRFRTAKGELLDPWNTGRMGCFTIRWPTTDLRRRASQKIDVRYRMTVTKYMDRSHFGHLSAVRVAKNYP